MGRPGMPRNLNLAPAVVFSGDAQQIAACSEPGILSVWNTQTGKKRASLSFSGNIPLAGAFLADGRSLVLDMSDGSAVLWELASGKERRVFGKVLVKAPKAGRMALVNSPGAGGARTTVALSPRGNLLAHAALDRVVHVWDINTGKEVASLAGHLGTIHAVVFAPDGGTLVSASNDTTALLWDLTAAQALQPMKRVLSGDELETRWASLHGDDAMAAFTAICELSASPAETVVYLKDRLKAAPMLDMKRVDQLIAKLDDANYKVRQKAGADLLKLGESVVPAIDKALTGNLALEPKKRLEGLRDRLTQTVLRDEAIRAYRAIETLERIGTPQAREILQVLADGAPGALTTTSAQAALTRLQGQNGHR
jgi:hypothetical protein